MYCYIRTTIAAALMVLAAAVTTPVHAQVQDFVVRNTNDSGDGSLRKAIADANGTPTTVLPLVRFEIPGDGPHVISLSSGLPALTKPNTTIDGYTQAGSKENTAPQGGLNTVIKIAVRQTAQVPQVFFVQAENITIRGLAIYLEHAQQGSVGEAAIRVDQNGTATIVGNFLGVKASGTEATSTTRFGVLVSGARGSIIGGDTPADRNLISGASSAQIELAAGSRIISIVGNLIGTSINGETPLPAVVPPGALASKGIAFSTDTAGIDILSNVIAGHSFEGVQGASRGAVISKNWIGTDVTGQRDLGNLTGIDVATELGKGDQPMSIVDNVIAFNRGHGVILRDNDKVNQKAHGRTDVQRNRIYSNRGLGIDVEAISAGVTSDDPGRAFPELTRVVTDGTRARIEGTLQRIPHTPEGDHLVQFFLNTTPDPPQADGKRFGEGEQFVGSVVVRLTPNGANPVTGTFALELPVAVKAGQWITATAAEKIPFPIASIPAGADEAETPELTAFSSEFSAAMQAVESLSISGKVFRNAQPVAGVTVTLSGGRDEQVKTDATGAYRFSFLEAGKTYTVTPDPAGGAPFSPRNATATAIAASQIFDFGDATHAISGTIIDANGTGVAGIPLRLSIGEALQRVAVTDAAGRFAFPNLVEGLTYRVTPDAEGRAFDFPFRDVVLTGDGVANFRIVVGQFTRYFAEGSTGSIWDMRLSLLAPNTSDVKATIEYLRADGKVITQPVTIKGQSLLTIDPSKVEGLESAPFSTIIRSDSPIVAERTMRWGFAGERFGRHSETSLPGPQTTWYLTEGATGCFAMFYLIQNPGDQAADVEVSFFARGAAKPIVKTQAVAPKSRFTFETHLVEGLGAAEVSAVVRSKNEVPILVERAMYTICSDPALKGGTVSAGVSELNTKWYFAEGATGIFFDAFLLLFNPDLTRPATVDIEFLLDDGRTVRLPKPISLVGRETLGVDGLAPELLNATMAMVVMSTNGVPIAAERAMWWPSPALTGRAYEEGHAVNGLTQPGTLWAVAGGEIGTEDLQTFLLIGNTGDAEARVAITLIFEDGTTKQQELRVAPHARATPAIADLFPDARDKRFGALVESFGQSAAPIVVERATYRSSIVNGVGQFWAEGAAAQATRLR